jgi:hypothetical protein
MNSSKSKVRTAKSEVRSSMSEVPTKLSTLHFGLRTSDFALSLPNAEPPRLTEHIKRRGVRDSHNNGVRLRFLGLHSK